MTRRKKVQKPYNTFGSEQCNRMQINQFQACGDFRLLKTRNTMTTPPKTAQTSTTEDNSIKTTPISRKRRPKTSLNRTLNVTNLNILFDSSCINNSPNLTPESNCSTRSMETKQREKCKCHESSIMDTPKINTDVLLNDFLKEIGSNNRQKDNNTHKTIIVDSNVNLNPYLKNSDVKFVQKDTSLGELSFFTPNLYNLKSASTPIGKFNLIDEKTVNHAKNEQITPESNFVYASAVKQKYQKNERRFSRSKRTSTRSPSRLNRVNHSHNNCSKINTKYNYDNVLRRIMDVLIKCRQLPGTVTWKIVEFCVFIGVTIRKALSTIWSMIPTDQPLLPTQQQYTTTITTYRTEISLLSIKIQELNEELTNAKCDLEKQKNNDTQLTNIINELNVVKFELNQYKDIRNELDKLKQQLNCIQNSPNTTINNNFSTNAMVTPSTAPSVAPPPPPPLPPLVPSLNTLKITKKTTKVNDENQRPIISLDDILKVKLKKTTDRPSPHGRRCSLQPMVTTDLLSQVKLKPAKKCQTPSSPSNSSLTKILNDNNTNCSSNNNNNTVWRVKRLKRLRGYSFDDISRRNEIARQGRERL